MINFNDLEQLAAFYRAGTLSEVAEKHNISQSTITRNMQKLEAYIGVPLFIRTKNSISLNETGVLAAKQAELVLEQQREMLSRVREFDRINRTISIGSCAPQPLTDVYRDITMLFPNMPIATEIPDNNDLLDDLLVDKYQLVIVSSVPADTNLIYKKAGGERLMFYLPRNHRFARRRSLTFAEMNGENMLLLNNIGFWRSIVDEKLPDSHFLVQNERYTFDELIENSVLPCFATDKTLQVLTFNNRTAIPISDSEARVEYFLVCKKEHRKRFMRLFRSDLYD